MDEWDGMRWDGSARTEQTNERIKLLFRKRRKINDTFVYAFFFLEKKNPRSFQPLPASFPFLSPFSPPATESFGLRL